MRLGRHKRRMRAWESWRACDRAARQAWPGTGAECFAWPGVRRAWRTRGGWWIKTCPRNRRERWGA